jgi:hypothetical protein
MKCQVFWLGEGVLRLWAAGFSSLAKIRPGAFKPVLCRLSRSLGYHRSIHRTAFVRRRRKVFLASTARATLVWIRNVASIATNSHQWRPRPAFTAVVPSREQLEQAGSSIAAAGQQLSAAILPGVAGHPYPQRRHITLDITRACTLKISPTSPA